MAESKKSKFIKNKAVALRYDKESNQAPAVIGKGEGLIAERIIALARENDIPIHADADLVEVLSRLKINEEIPPETYILVAEILAFIYRANEKYQPER
ncbi:EscU/YscU/HrcU family type III secretion system export apparatus switch protein [Desulfobacterota bacterium M19]